MYEKPTEPLSIGGVLDDGFRLLKACFGKAFILGVIISLLTNTPNALLQLSVQDGDVGTGSAVAGFLLLACFLVAVIFYGALVALVDGIANGEDPSIQDACRVGMKRYLPVLGCLITYALLVLLGYFALLIPGVILTVSLLFANYLVVTDNLGVIEALKRSHRLVWGDWWRTSIMLTILAFIFMVIYLFIAIIGGVGVLAGDDGASVPAVNFISLVVVPLISALITPPTYAFGMAIFNDLKMRKEGVDLEQRIEAIGEG